MPLHSPFFASCLLSFLLVSGVCQAQKYNLTEAIEATLVADYQPPGATCDVSGICKPVNQTLPARSMWYWCGFISTHRTAYVVKSISASGANVTTMFLMRRQELEGCALSNVTWVGDRCKTIPESSCSNKRTCDVRVFGLVFRDDTCFVMINNRASSIVATVQVHNYYDRPRYYGTCFVLLFVVAGGMAILGNVGWQIYSIIIAPVGKHTTPVAVKRADAKSDPERGAAPAAGSPPGTPGGKNSLYGKLVGKLKAQLGGAGAAHQA